MLGPRCSEGVSYEDLFNMHASFIFTPLDFLKSREYQEISGEIHRAYRDNNNKPFSKRLFGFSPWPVVR